MTAADGRLIHRNGNGVVTLIEVSKEGIYKKRGEFTVAPIAGTDLDLPCGRQRTPVPA